MSNRGREKKRGRSPAVRSDVSSPKTHEGGVPRGQHDVTPCTSCHVLAAGCWEWASTAPVWGEGQGDRLVTCAVASPPSSDTNFASGGWKGPSRGPFLGVARGGLVATGAAASFLPLAASISQVRGGSGPPEVRLGEVVEKAALRLVRRRPDQARRRSFSKGIQYCCRPRRGHHACIAVIVMHSSPSDAVTAILLAGAVVESVMSSAEDDLAMGDMLAVSATLSLRYARALRRSVVGMRSARGCGGSFYVVLAM